MTVTEGATLVSTTPAGDPVKVTIDSGAVPLDVLEVQINEWIAAGVIGPVKEVHVWTNHPVGYWPQGVPRPIKGASVPEDQRWSQRGFPKQIASAIAGDFSPFACAQKKKLALATCPTSSPKLRTWGVGLRR